VTPVLEFRSVGKHFDRLKALEQVSFAIERGQVLALLGPNGAGKSTLFGCLLGLLRPSAGEILLNGHLLTATARLRFGYLPERIALYPHRSVWENGVFFARLRDCPRAQLECQLKRVGLYAMKDRPARHLSKGMLQRLGLAIALCGKPDLLVLDEPFNGLDPVLLDSLQSILREENQGGATLLISTHTISAVESLATHVAILMQGRLAAFSPLDELREGHRGRSLDAIYQRIARGALAHALEEVCA
jgi:ABC-type multidrug transport system ATPase subunit